MNSSNEEEKKLDNAIFEVEDNEQIKEESFDRDQSRIEAEFLIQEFLEKISEKIKEIQPLIEAQRKEENKNAEKVIKGEP